MRTLLLALACAACTSSCGAAVDSTASQSGGPAMDAAADQTSPDADDGGAFDVPDAGPQCTPDGGYVWDVKTCQTDDDCQTAVHTQDCCGSQQWVGVGKGQAGEYAACEAAWVDSLPSCGCDPKPTTAEDGNDVFDGKMVVVECVDFTMNAGICKTRVVQGPPDAGSDAPATWLIPSIVSMSMSADCMPQVPSDAINGTFSAAYDNSAGGAAAVASITSARLLLSAIGGPQASIPFTVTPASSGPVGPGTAATVTHTKQAGSAPGSSVVCSAYCGGQWTLEVTWDVGGASVGATLGPQPILCAM